MRTAAAIAVALLLAAGSPESCLGRSSDGGGENDDEDGSVAVRIVFPEPGAAWAPWARLNLDVAVGQVTQHI
jgi:hypothetical protein